MTPDEYKYIDINDVSIAYTDYGQGQTMLMVHGFASFSYTWLKLLSHLPEKFRVICVDLKGHGFSEKKCDDNLSPFDQAVILSEFIKKMDLKNFILTGHSMGGAISLMALFNDDIKERVDKLILLDCTGVVQKIPEFIADLTSTSPGSYLVKYTNEDLVAWLFLKQAFYDESKIDEELVTRYGDVLRQEHAKECLVASAKLIKDGGIRSFHEKLKDIDIPTLIIWGEDDNIVDLEEAQRFKSDLRNAELEVISECGHSPQEETPYMTAVKIADFLGVEVREKDTSVPKISDVAGGISGKDVNQEKTPVQSGVVSNSVKQIKEESGSYIRKPEMRRLVDRWTLGTMVIVVFLKILQFLKKIGFKAEENGWRKATGIFLRKEHSKFMLASFRLNYLRKDNGEVTFDQAKKLLVERLAEFLKRNPACHWTLDWGRFRVKRKKVFFTDIFEAQFDNDGILLKLIPHLDNSRESFYGLNDEIIDCAVNRAVELYNQYRHLEDHRRAWKIEKRLRRWARKYKLSYAGRQELRHLVERILNGTIIQFEILTDQPEKLTKSRLATPKLNKRKHPGSGLMNIVCRFTCDYKEVDLWFQHHHVPVDGMPMQEMLESLKEEWGEVDKVCYPSMSREGAMPEIFYFGDRIFRARVYVDFENIIALRRRINEKYYAEMGGPATIASIIIWGLAHSDFFKDKKFLFPVDTASIVDFPSDRNISLLVIRPSKFFNPDNVLDGFLKYQREFNHRLLATRMGKSESYEMLELYSMTHPLFYYIAKYFMPKALYEILGSVGVTIIKNAEMFVSPLTDVQVNGFMAIGNLRMPTEDGNTAGAVSMCGSREQVKEHIKAINNLSVNSEKYIGI